ncbi:hypothetical protein [Streptomyces sp. NPDC046161]|uniref:hypothetical protein n=1 Tax=Streptomyces sp. NPDC046161 TaxID=3155132 RepID=UPI0033CAB66D
MKRRDDEQLLSNDPGVGEVLRLGFGGLLQGDLGGCILRPGSTDGARFDREDLLVPVLPSRPVLLRGAR